MRSHALGVTHGPLECEEKSEGKVGYRDASAMANNHTVFAWHNNLSELKI